MAAHLFAGAGYYPQSGLGDYRGSFDNDDEAIAEGKRLIDGNPSQPYSGEEWYSVIVERDGSLVEIDNGWKQNL